jgi:predicted solute-binding protein
VKAADLATLRIGCVSYLNSKPLIYGLGDGVSLMHPAPLARALHAHELDIALVPVFECFLHPGYRILDGFGICCHGPVKSVFLAHHVPLAEIRTIALDAASLTSANLLRVLCAKHFQIQPRFVEQGESAEAELWIGDQALNYLASHPQTPRIDLGQAWLDYAGLPFAFAVWAVHPDAELSQEQAEVLREIFESGLGRRREVAAAEEDYEYLTRFIRYEIGTPEKEAIRRFGDECRKLGLVGEGGRELVFV